MKASIQSLAAGLAASMLAACGGGHDLRSVAPISAAPGQRGTVHRVQTIERPHARILAGSREYTFQTVVVHGTDDVDHMFSAPQSVTATADGVRVVTGAGRVVEFAGGEVVSRGTGQYYVLPGRELPKSLSHATPGRTFLKTEFRTPV